MGNGRIIDGSLALKNKERKIITIEATQGSQIARLRVAAYARVSSSSDDQLNSFGAQTRYYTKLISDKKDWELVDIYADEGITGTSVEKRDDFKRLMSDCRRGRIDRVLVKSISRFARNTLECLEAIRELKGLGIGVYFEEQRIDTAAMSGEMVTALFAAIAQEESKSISEKMRWSFQRRMEKGIFVPSSQPFGYILSGGEIKIDLPRAKYVCEIFTLYLSGKNTREIADHLNGLYPDHPELGDNHWTYRRVVHILQNEKYIGDSLWQKSFHTDTLPRREPKNHGELEQYYAEGTHPAIIEKAIYEKARSLLLRHNYFKVPGPGAVASPFRGSAICGKCGGSIRRKEVNGKAYLVCRTHEVSPQVCDILPLSEAQIKQAFLRLYFNLKHQGADILPQMLSSLQTMIQRKMLWSPDIVELNKRIADLSSENQMWTEYKRQGVIDPDVFLSRTNELSEQLRLAKLEKERLMESSGDDTIPRTQELIDVLESGPENLDLFDSEMFDELVDKIIVESNDSVRFRLQNGLELRETIERTIR